ncbi:MAG: methionyl-tRNA formyltransferase [Spirochaetes bacterium]|nr:methionyl-tRNA formyltransferase [Spirochaetota bacterium]
MRILFAGSPGIAVPGLLALARVHEIVAVLTNPDSHKGRGMGGSRTPVAEAACALGIPVLAPERLDPDARETVAGFRPELMAVYAYGKIFGPKFLSLFPSGSVNVHPSLLPRWRGCAPIPAAILARDRETGVVVQRVSLGMDEGELLAREVLPLGGRETAESLSAIAAETGARLLLSTVDRLALGPVPGEPQDGSGASYCSKLRKEDGILDFASSALDLDARVRAFHPWPGACTAFGGVRLAVIESFPYPDEDARALPGTVVALDKSRGIMVQTGKGLLALLRLQLQSKKALPHRDFANGTRGLPGAVLGIAACANGKKDETVI